MKIILRLLTLVVLLLVSYQTLQVSNVPQKSVKSVKIAQEVTENKTTVVRVVDGDTIVVLVNNIEEKIRIIGINTPETVDPRKKVECFGKQASDKAKQLLTGQEIKLKSDPTQADRDKYKRLLRYISLPDGTDYGLKMIQEGYAYEYTYLKPYKYQKEFMELQTLARTSERGLWAKDTCAGIKSPAK